MISIKARFKQSIMQIFATCILILGSASQAYADAKWEIGMGLGHLSSHAYIGSDETISLTTPVPFIKLKTDWFDLSEGNVKMKWFKDTPFSLGFNFDLGLPVDSSKIALRQGMSDLDPILQVGPMLSYQIQSNTAVKWQVEVPFLFASSVDGTNFEGVGWTFTPRLALRLPINKKIDKKKSSLDLSVSLGPVYGAKKFHQYHYSVSQSDATADRAVYDAEGGYAGYRFNISFTKRVDDLWFGMFLRYHNLSGAEFNASPLVAQDDYLLVTFAVSWIFISNL